MTDILDINELKKTLADFAQARDWEKFHSPKNISMALAGEAGELLEIFQWMSEPESINAAQSSTTKEAISHELADIMLYAIRMASLLDINLNMALHAKIALNKEKYPIEKVKGSAKKYLEY